MSVCKPQTPQELAAALREAADNGRVVELLGNGTKSRAGGPVATAAARISTAALDQVLQYEPKDLTVSVGAGMPYRRFTEMLRGDGYMVPLDPPFAHEATVGGVVAANSSGPRRRLYGTARDLVIGMKFATMEGKLVQSGGMVVKNVAGLDMGKLMIGSFGTLAAMATLNFKLIPRPAFTRTFLYQLGSGEEAIAIRDRTIRSVLQPAAMDVLNPAAAKIAFGRDGWLLAIGVNGNAAAVDRYSREFADAEGFEGDAEGELWKKIEEFTPSYLAANAEGAVVRCSFTLKQLGEAARQLPGAVVIRAANGVCYAHVEDAEAAQPALQGGKAVMEYGPSSRTRELSMWPEPGNSFPMMQRVKEMFDPKNLLNPGRLYGRI